MEITKDTRVSDILREYGDIAPVMEAFGVKRVGRYSVRRMLTKALTRSMKRWLSGQRSERAMD